MGQNLLPDTSFFLHFLQVGLVINKNLQGVPFTARPERVGYNLYLSRQRLQPW